MGRGRILNRKEMRADYDAAERLTSDPRHAAAQGYCWQRLSQWDLAEASYKKAIAGGYRSAALYSNLGALQATKQPDEARRSCEQALELEPSFPLAHYNLANVHLRFALKLEQRQVAAAGNPRFAANDSEFQAHLALAKKHVDRALALSAAAASRGMYYEATRIYALASRVDPRDLTAALDRCERAVAAGVSIAALQGDVYRHLHAQPRFAALKDVAGAPAMPPPPGRLADPIVD